MVRVFITTAVQAQKSGGYAIPPRLEKAWLKNLNFQISISNNSNLKFQILGIRWT